jgi:hypothetical protein
MHGLVPPWIPPPQVRVERLARHVVWKHSAGSAFDERLLTQPVEHRFRILVRTEDCPQQLLSCVVSVCTNLQGMPVHCRRHRTHQLREQCPDNVWPGRPAPRRRYLHLCHFRGQRQRQRMSASEIDDPRTQFDRYPSGIQ